MTNLLLIGPKMLCTKARTELSTNVLFPTINAIPSSISSVGSESDVIGQFSGLPLSAGWFGDNVVLVDLAGDVALSGSAGLVDMVCFEGNVDLVCEVGLVCLVGVVGLKKPLS